MMGLITPIMLVAISVGAFMFYIDPTYAEIRTLQSDVEKHNEALTKANELRQIRTELSDKRKEIGDDKIERLLKLIPNNLDSVRLILDLDALAIRYGMRLADLTLEEKPDAVPQGELASVDVNKYNSINIGFSVKGTYKDVRAFIRALESSLRLVDIESISFGQEGADGTYVFKLDLKTYWLK